MRVISFDKCQKTGGTRCLLGTCTHWEGHKDPYSLHANNGSCRLFHEPVLIHLVIPDNVLIIHSCPMTPCIYALTPMILRNHSSNNQISAMLLNKTPYMNWTQHWKWMYSLQCLHSTTSSITFHTCIGWYTQKTLKPMACDGDNSGTPINQSNLCSKTLNRTKFL